MHPSPATPHAPVHAPSGGPAPPQQPSIPCVPRQWPQKCRACLRKPPHHALPPPPLVAAAGWTMAVKTPGRRKGGVLQLLPPAEPQSTNE
eukprot:901748-Pelagomonas_calceolata.AAC.1